MEEPLLKIGEIAAFFNVSVKAIRIYEKKEIIKPVKIDPVTGYRYYSADQIKQINSLLELKSLGFSLSEIQKILTGKLSNDQLMEALAKKRAAWQDAISSAEYKIDCIESISERLSRSENAKKLPELTEDERAWLLVKMVCVEDMASQSVISQAIWL